MPFISAIALIYLFSFSIQIACFSLKYYSFGVYLTRISGLMNLLFVPGHIVLAEKKS